MVGHQKFYVQHVPITQVRATHVPHPVPVPLPAHFVGNSNANNMIRRSSPENFVRNQSPGNHGYKVVINMVNRPSSNVVTPGQGLNRVPINNFLNPVPNNFPSRISEPINIQPPTPRL